MHHLSPLILASQSPVRSDMLRNEGVIFTVHPSPYDEDTEKEHIAHLPPAQQAAWLAAGKAHAVSILYPDAYVIGADQICDANEQILGKPYTVENALTHLRLLQNTTHFQHSAACVYKAGENIWAMIETVTLTMHPLNDDAIRAYIGKDQPFAACGAYCYEKTGHHLFSHVEGSASAIKGLPLTALLAFLQL